MAVLIERSEAMTHPVRRTALVSTTVLVAILGGAFVFRAAPQTRDVKARAGEFSLDGPYAYSVEYLGVTCGLMTLESRLEDYRGKPAYHVVMTARNSKFFNKIYRVDGRIDSWVDPETMTTIAYESDITEKGERKIRRYEVDREKGVVLADKHGEQGTFPYDGRPALDPLAFVYRGRVLAEPGVESFSLNALSDRGVIETVSIVGERKRFNTYDGKRELLRVQPMPADSEMFSRKGEFVYWIDPGPTRTLYRIDFKLGFGKLLAKLKGPAQGPADRRMTGASESDDD
jgi:hypothetical protein